MRLEHRPAREMLRALVTAVGTLRRAGIAAPAEHIVMVTARSGNFTALLVKKTPFTADERRRLAAWANASPYFGVSAAPERNAGRERLYQVFLDLQDPASGAGLRGRVPVRHLARRPTTGRSSSSTRSWGHLFAARPRPRAPACR